MTHELTSADFALMAGKSPEEVEKEKLFLCYLFDPTREHPDPLPILRQGERNLLTLGNFSCITGQAKSRKSFLVTSLTGAFLHPEGFLNMEGTTHTGSVLYADTEQAEGHVSRIYRRICRIADLPADTPADAFTLLALREASPEERKEIIEYAIARLRPTLIIIDGIADLFANGVDDEREATGISGWLLRLTSEFNCHIITVLHTNPNTTKARGHAGSEIVRKAETVLHVSKEGENSKVEPLFCRDREIDPFAFFVGNEGLPILTEIEEKKPSRLRLVEGFSKVLPLPLTLSFTDLRTRVVAEFDVKPDTAKKKIRQALEEGVIEKNNIGLYHLTIKERDIEEEFSF